MSEMILGTNEWQQEVLYNAFFEKKSFMLECKKALKCNDKSPALERYRNSAQTIRKLRFGKQKLGQRVFPSSSII